MGYKLQCLDQKGSPLAPSATHALSQWIGESRNCWALPHPCYSYIQCHDEEVCWARNIPSILRKKLNFGGKIVSNWNWNWSKKNKNGHPPPPPFFFHCQAWSWNCWNNLNWMVCRNRLSWVEREYGNKGIGSHKLWLPHVKAIFLISSYPHGVFKKPVLRNWHFLIKTTPLTSYQPVSTFSLEVIIKRQNRTLLRDCGENK